MSTGSFIVIRTYLSDCNVPESVDLYPDKDVFLAAIHYTAIHHRQTQTQTQTKTSKSP